LATLCTYTAILVIVLVRYIFNIQNVVCETQARNRNI